MIISRNIALLTWLDVERRLREVTQDFNKLPEFINRIDCYSECLEINVSNKEKLNEWLNEVFGNSFDRDNGNLLLRISDIKYPIEIEMGKQEKSNPLVIYPLWRDFAFISKDSHLKSPEPFKNTNIVAFHSFKGGVGRTTTLITYLAAFLEKNKGKKTKILLIDADLEAPGITYLVNKINLPTLSFIRFLESVHYPPAGLDDSIQYCASELRKVSLEIEGHEIFILPACTNPDNPIELLDTPVLPEHLVRNIDNPWIVGDMISLLANALNSELVLVDLRAGLSELSSPLLFDSRIERFIVSTIAPQSIQGVTLILEKIALLRSLIQDSENFTSIPTIILSLLTPILKDSKYYHSATQTLLTIFNNEKRDDDINIEFIDSFFNDNLMYLGEFKIAIDLTKKASLFSEFKKLITIPALSNTDGDKHLTTNTLDEAKKLAKVCEDYIYAEKGKSERFLITEALKNLAKHYQDAVPNVVSIGAKGAGKTFNFLQLCRFQTWENFLEKVLLDDYNNKPFKKKTLIFPLLIPKHLEAPAKEIIKNCRANCFKELGVANEFQDSDLENKIQKALSSKEINWMQFWIECIVETFQLKNYSLKEFYQFLTDKEMRLVIVIDGLEELFPKVEEENPRNALNSLLFIQNRIEEINDNPLGVIEFIRADYVSAVILQNAGQFKSRYEAYELKWTAESFLRLAYWICQETNLEWAKNRNFESLSIQGLLEALYPLWGQKLGSNKSKEAHAARWIFTALCDLNGFLQARDLVRFLRYSAEKTKERINEKNRPKLLEDRMLLPEAIREAINTCSTEKVEEAAQEITALREWKERLQNVEKATMVIPFDAEKVGFKPNDELLTTLIKLGVIFEDKDKLNDKDRFYLPESYRTGLGFTLTATGRPKVLVLIKRNVNLPF